MGIVYQAGNGCYLRRTAPRTLHVLPDGSVLNERALAKVRSGDRGRAYVERTLRRFGAPTRRRGESGSAWLEHALAAAGVRRLRHGGCHRYAFAIGGRAARRAARIGLPERPYPKLPDVGDVAAVVRAGAAAPRLA